MSIKKILLGVGAAIFALAAGLSTVGTISADAATPQCGPHCVGVFSRLYGSPSQPNFIETTQNGVGVVGNPNILSAVSGSNSAEDFFPLRQTVPAFYAEGLVSADINSRYGSLSGVQIEYAPLGMASGLCSGVPGRPHEGEGLTLQPCGQASTVWILDTTVPGGDGYFALVNGTGTDFTHPYVMTYPDKPPAQIVIGHLRVDSSDGNHHTVPYDQLWGAVFGPLS